MEKALPELAELGFDVVYLPPIHPIGLTNRKGRNNALDGGARRSRLALGDRRRGAAATTRSHPELGTIDDLRALTERRRRARASTSRSTSRSSARPTTPG